MSIATAELKRALIESKKISDEDFRKIQETAKYLNSTVEQVLLGKGFFTETELGKILGDYFGAEYVDLSKQEISPQILLSIPKDIAIKKKVVVFEKGRGVMHIAMANPRDLETIDYIKKSTGYNVKVFYAFGDEISATLKAYQEDISQLFVDVIEKNVQKSKKEIGKVEDVAKKVSITKVVDTIIEYAVNESASDIHIEPLETEVLIRYRIDGELKDIITLPKDIHPVLVARVKILSGLRIDEHRLPQDGRIAFIVNNAKISLRVSILPIFYGEKVVMRVLDESAKKFSLEDLGVMDLDLKVMKRNISKPHGMILVTGPTGSGKTTTLYTILNILNTTDVNINTVEDPIEYSMPRINQMQVRPKIGLDFSIGLRALLRQDPDIIMVGEIRDLETVKMAVNAAMTGHLVLSTLHTNSAAATIPRLLDMGVQPFLIASTVNVILAQRLVRKLCNDCKKQIKIPEKLLKSLKDELKKQGLTTAQITKVVGNGNFYKAVGCKKCGGKGYKGRLGIFEIMEMSSDIMELAISNATTLQLQQQAIKDGVSTMLYDGIHKAADGLTTIEEVLAATRE